MKRQEYNFPVPRKERLTQVYSPYDDLTSVGFLEIDRSSISAPVFYRRSLPKKISNEKLREKQLLVIGHEPEIDAEKSITHKKGQIVPEEEQVVSLETKETEKIKSITKLIVKKRDIKVKELRPSLQSVEPVEEHLEKLPTYNRVSVVMAFRGREDGRFEGLKKCIRSLREQTLDCYIILVEQDKIPVHQAELEPLVDSYLFTYSPAMFNKSWAFNCGVMIAPDDLIFLHDCDLLVPRNYVRESIRLLGTRDITLPWAKILYLTEESSKQYPGGNPKVSSIVTSHQGVGGSILVRKQFYLRIGGMDERFEGWGHEDNAFYVKAIKLGRMNRVSPITGLILLHHYHKLAPRSHPNSHINGHVLMQGYQGSDLDIMAMVKRLDPIGDPWKYTKEKERDDDQQTSYHRSATLAV